MTDEALGTDAARRAAPLNYPLVTLAALGVLFLISSGVTYGVATQSLESDTPWDSIGPVADAWIVVLFWIGVLCLVGTLIALAVDFSIERALSSRSNGR